MIILKTLLSYFFMCVIGGGLLLFIHRFDEECAFKLKHPTILLLAVYYMFAAYATACMESVFLTVMFTLFFAVLGTEGLVDLQTSFVYNMQGILCFIFAAVTFLVLFLRGDITDHVTAKSEGITKAAAEIFNQYDTSVVAFLAVCMVILYLLGVIKSIAMADVAAFFSAAIMYLAVDTKADQRFFVCLLVTYSVFVTIYFACIIYDKVKNNEKILKKRYPFTAPIALGTLAALFII